MLKKIYYAFSFYAIFMTGISQPEILKPSQSHVTPQTIRPENTIIAFDLHDVIFEISTTKLFKKLAHLAWRGDNGYAVAKALINPFFWYAFFNIKSETGVWEERFNRIVKQYPALLVAKTGFIDGYNDMPINQEVYVLIKYLHHQGYHLYILSNCGEEAFIDLQKRHPDLFQYFKGHFIPRPSNGYMYKPQPQFYAAFKSYLQTNGDGDKSIILIDDSLKKIKGALDSGLMAIKFESPRQLIDDMVDAEIIEEYEI
jgi:FMN phosphatase YigB (HAD superfamily)